MTKQITKEPAKEKAEYKIAKELGGIEVLNASYHKQNFSRHSHEGYTLGVIDTGAQRFYRTGSDHVAPQDSIILVNADEVHTGQSATDYGWSYGAIYPKPEQFAEIAQELNTTQSGAPYFPNPVVEDKKLAQLLRLTMTNLRESDNPLLRESLLYSVLVKLMTKHARVRDDVNRYPNAKPQVLLVKQFIDDMPGVDVSLQELATLAGLSPFYLLKQFSKTIGLPPHAYQTQVRIRLAKSLLHSGESIIHTAQYCGFHDQSHLYRHFKKAIGITPGQFVKACRQT